MTTIGYFPEDLKTFLEKKGYSSIFKESLPEDIECIGLFLKEHINSKANDGTGTRIYEIQVQRTNPEEAYSVAHDICTILNSGTEEEMIFLTDNRWCLATPQTLPTKTASQSSMAVYNFKVALWGANEK